MAKFKPQYRRLLHIDRKIREGRYPNCSSLAAEWETSTRTIQRDIDYIKYELDAPLEYNASKRGYAYTNASWFLPAVMLTEGDLLALLIGEQAMAMYCGTPVAKDLQRIYGKLSELLPEEISIGQDFIASRFSFFNPPSRPILPQVWRKVLHTVLHHKVLEINYHSATTGKKKMHVLHPYHVLNMEGDWYLLAHSEKQGELRQFALSRILSASCNAHKFTIPDSFVLDEALRSRFGRYLHQDGPKKKIRVKLLIDKTLNRYIHEKQWHPEQTLTNRKNGSVELMIPVASTVDLESWILSLGEYVSVLTPKSLKDKISRRHLAAAKL